MFHVLCVVYKLSGVMISVTPITCHFQTLLRRYQATYIQKSLATKLNISVTCLTV